jgi:hypothetical protein
MNRSMVRITAVAAVLAAAAFATARPANAIPVPPTNAPLERLLKNTDAYLAKNPGDPDGYFTRGRLRYFAFAQRRETVPVVPGGADQGLPQVYDVFRVGRPSSPGEQDQAAPAMSQARQKSLVQGALADLKRAIALRNAQEKKGEGSGGASEPESIEGGRRGLYELTLASVYEDGKTLAAPDWREKAIAAYRASYLRSAPEDLKRTQQPIFGLGKLVSHEAGQGYLRLVSARGVKSSEKALVLEVNQGLEKLKNLRPGPVTPVVFSLKPSTSLADLLHAPARPVRFDLSGSELPQRYALWPRPDTALLVWDPAGAGRITSGRQLFGTATWWLMYPDGYRALDALDDDRNGWLEGGELRGLALWFDRDGDGVSDPGEVVPAPAAGVEGIAVRAAVGPDGVLGNPRGLRLRGGARLLPTYDWVASPVGD